MIKFLLLVLAFNLIGYFLERMKRNAQKKKQMEYDGNTFEEEEESLPPPVAAPEDILGDLFKKLEIPSTSTKPYEDEHRSESLEAQVVGRAPDYHEYNAKEFDATEHKKQEHEKIRDGRGLIELMEAKQQSPFSEPHWKTMLTDEGNEQKIAKPTIEVSLPKIEQHRTSSVGRSKIRVNLREGMILKEILGAPRGVQPWSI